jgi:hypothetical protein
MEKQFLDFPNWKHDDIIDCFTQWYIMLNRWWVEDRYKAVEKTTETRHNKAKRKTKLR